MEKSGKQVPPSSSAQSLLDSNLGEPSSSNAPSTSAENGVERSQSQNLFTNQTPSLFMRFMNLGISGEQLPESSQSHSNEEAQNAIDVNGADEEVEQKDVERQDEVDRMSDDGYPLVMDLGHSERQSRMAKQRLIEQVIQEQGQAFEQDVMEELENANSRRVFDPIEEGEGSSTQRPANALNHDGMAFTPRVEAAIAHYMVRKYADGGNAARSPDAFGSVAVDGISVEPPPPPPPEDEPSSSSMDAPPVNILPASRNLPMSNFIAIGRRPFRTNKNRRPVANSRGDSSSLGWQATKPSLKDRLGYMFCNEVLADVYFIVGKDEQRQRIPAHKFVLSIGSVVFDAMFNGGLTPSNSRDPLEIELPDVEPPAFLTLLRFLYSDEVNIGPESVMTTLYTEAVVQTCILNNDAARQMAWQTIGTWGMELIIATNLTLSAVRFTTIMWGQKIAQRVAIFGLTLSVVWTVTFTFLQHFGIVKRIWYDGDSNYQEEHFFPFNIIRLPLFFAEIFLTLLLYLASLLRLKTIGRNAMSSTVKSREIRFLAQSIIIFVNELIFLYATYWFGYNYLGIGDSIFNANLNYWARPLTTGCTPFLYLAFSSAVRNAVKTSFPFNLCGENTKIVQIGTNSNNRRATVSSYSSMNASPH